MPQRGRWIVVSSCVGSTLIKVADVAWVMLPAQLGDSSRAIGLARSQHGVGILPRLFIAANTISRLGDYAGLAPATTGMIGGNPLTGKSDYGY
jgi:hypothetical protein